MNSHETLRIAVPFNQTGRIGSRRNYFDALAALGAVGVDVGKDVDAAEFDGLLLPGGGDIEPSRYGAENTGSVGIDLDMDAAQFAALDAFVRAGKPILGICRGLQLVNVGFGGTMIQDLPQRAAHAKEGTDPDKVHRVVAEPDSVFARLYDERFSVNSSHHQGVDRPGDGLRVTLMSEDGVVEGLEHRSLPIVCVQFHPERMAFKNARTDTVDGRAVFDRFLASCRDRRR